MTQPANRFLWIRQGFAALLAAACLLVLAAPGQPSAKPATGAALLLVDEQGREILSTNADRPMIPASTLKVLTSLVALYYMGPHHRFVTEFYLDNQRNLKIKGYGDPLLISENIAEMAAAAAGRLADARIAPRDLVMDDSFFGSPSAIPGVGTGFEPYDAVNGALSVNFNTVAFARRGGRWVTGEAQTPLVPVVLERIRRSGLRKGRISLSPGAHSPAIYAGHLLRHFLLEAGVSPEGRVRLGRVDTRSDRLLYRFQSPFNLEQVLERMLAHSNNFIANQLLLTLGGRLYGQPATLAKGLRAVHSYAGKLLGLHDLQIAEGSGISRQNRLSARQMNRILAAFAPYRKLMRRQGREFYKTGTLKDVRTRVGYLEADNGRCFRFVVMVNSGPASAGSLMRRIRQEARAD